MTLIPAYCRDYKSKAEILKDLNADKDFEVASFVHGSGYVNLTQLRESKVTSVVIRYKQNRSAAAFKIPPTGPVK